MIEYIHGWGRKEMITCHGWNVGSMVLQQDGTFLVFASINCLRMKSLMEKGMFYMYIK